MEHKDLEIFKNTTKTYELRFTRDGITEDITGWTVYFTVKENISDDDNDAVIKKDITTFEEATAGKALIELDTTDTNRVGNYYYDIKYKDDEDNTGILVSGRIKFIASVTQRN